MKTTDYSKIANNYDNEDYRWKIGVDRHLSEVIENTEMQNVIDLACGTGNFLQKQSQFFKNSNITWHGLDNSSDMLKIAEEKLPVMTFVNAPVEDIPYENSTFDFVSSRSSFHHFVDKPKAISEMIRILKPNGMIKIVSISPEYMDCSWVYHYFPETVIEDQKRFWTHKAIYREFELKGFSPEVQIEYTYSKVRVSNLLQEAKNKDMSQFHLITDEEYKKGIQRLEKELELDRESEYKTNLARMIITVRK